MGFLRDERGRDRSGLPAVEGAGADVPRVRRRFPTVGTVAYGSALLAMETGWYLLWSGCVGPVAACASQCFTLPRLALEVPMALGVGAIAEGVAARRRIPR